MYILYEIFHDTNPIHLGALNNNGGRYEKLLLLWLFVVVVILGGQNESANWLNRAIDVEPLIYSADFPHRGKA